MGKQNRTRDPAEGAHAGHRHERLSRLFREELDALLRDELDDPRLDGVRVTYVELSVDYKNAKVGVVGPHRDDRERLLRALAGATPLVRARLADAVDLKAVPAIRFVWDALAAEAPPPDDET